MVDTCRRAGVWSFIKQTVPWLGAHVERLAGALEAIAALVKFDGLPARGA